MNQLCFYEDQYRPVGRPRSTRGCGGYERLWKRLPSKNVCVPVAVARRPSWLWRESPELWGDKLPSIFPTEGRFIIGCRGRDIDYSMIESRLLENDIDHPGRISYVLEKTACREGASWGHHGFLVTQLASLLSWNMPIKHGLSRRPLDRGRGHHRIRYWWVCLRSRFLAY
jgi:hypothetical protein